MKNWLSNFRHMRLPDNIPLWLLLAGLYCVWNFSQYLSQSLFSHNQYVIDLVYWFNERIFVVAVWFFIYHTIKKSRWFEYKWIPITFIWIAILKTIYLAAILGGWIKKNDLAALMAFIFITTTGFILTKWERLRRN